MNILTLINATKIFGQVVQEKISPRLAYKILKLCKGAAEEEQFYDKKRTEIIQEYAVKDDNGQVKTSEDGMISIIPDKITEANKAIQELNELEVEAPNIKFTLDELEELKLSVSDMFVLEAFIEE